MNVWYRHVILLGEGFDPERIPAVFAAIQGVIGEHPKDKAYEPAEPGFKFAFETEAEDCLQEHDEDAVQKAVVNANGRPCVVMIQEHRIAESDPESVTFGLDGERVL